MDRGLVAALLVVSVVTAGIAPLVAATTTTEGAGESTDVSPGQRLAAAVASQGTELRGEVAIRALNMSFEKADTNASKANILAKTLSEIEAQIEELQAKQERLAAQYDNGSISFGEYAARTAQLLAQERVLSRMLEVSANQAEQLPEEVLNQQGVSLDAIAELKERAGNASGQAISEIAREIAGPPIDVANKTQAGPDNESGPPAQKAIKSAASVVRSVEQQVATADRIVDGGQAADTLEQARSKLNEAKDLLAAARDAAQAGNAAEARELAATAKDLANQARDLAETARQQANSNPGQGNQTGTPTGGESPDTGQEPSHTTGSQPA